MILKVIGIFSAFVCLHVANGASYSKVFVHSGAGPDVVPVEYVNYGPPVIGEPQIAQLAAAPVRSVVSVPPCVSPCVVGQNVAPIAPVAPVPNAKFITYNSPNVPVVVAPKDNGYEYSYIVYDENTGDRKAQREFSDGSVVRGEYSFVQPDGYVREVQYRADDLTGFNVVVKRIPADSVGTDKKQEKADVPPCKDVKSEALKEEPKQELVEDNSHAEPSHDHDNDGVPDHAAVDHVEEPAKDVEVVAPVQQENTHEEVHEAPAEPEHAQPEPAQDEHVEPAPAVPEHAEPQQEEKPAQHEEPSQEEAHGESHGAIVVPEEHAPEPVPALPIPIPQLPNNLLVSYEDIIRCVQSKAQSPQGLNISPLTYIILPAANRPC